jgi:Zn-finger nucleic acid-binding protein
MSGGPYRDDGLLRCPRCHGSLEGNSEVRLRCTSGCGDWLARSALEHRWTRISRSEPDVASLIGRPWPATGCPICECEMRVSIQSAVVFDHCDDHGVWLDRGEYASFAAALGLVTT